MADKKNIVIKVKYPKSAPATAERKEASQWHYPRIAAALAVLALTITAAVYFFRTTPPAFVPAAQTTRPPARQPSEAAALGESPAAGSGAPASAVRGRVVRAVLASDVAGNEPVDALTSPLTLSRKKPTWIYYFLELVDMKGMGVYHEWRLDGRLVSRKKVNISENFWRTASRQVFRHTTRHNWTVRLVAEDGSVLNEIPFTVIYK